MQAVKMIFLSEQASVPTPPSGYVFLYIDSADHAVKTKNSAGTVASLGAGYTDEQARDAIGAMLADSSTIDVTYNDAGDTETIDVKDASISTAKLVDANVTLAKLASLATATVIGRNTGSTGVPEAVTMAQLRTLLGVPTLIVKPSDTTRTSTATFADDPDLSFAIGASDKVRIRAALYYNTGATPDIKFQIAGPASPTLVRFFRFAKVPSSAAFSFIGYETAFSAGSATLSDTGSGNGILIYEGFIQNGANAGTVSIQWSQNTNDASNTILYAGSYLEWMKF